jgi:2-polyprenyl-3-methyl-5-hydroxy-6-metoxy-1,4-benzoquinol methylase
MRVATALSAGGESTLAGCWCGAPDRLVRFRTRQFGLLECRECGSFQIDPPPIGHADEARAFYTNYYYERPVADGPGTRGETRSSRFWQVARVEPSLHRVGRRAMDIGCGEGHLCGELRAAGWPEVVGIDVSQTRIERARRQHPGVQFYDRPVEETPVAEGTCDLVVMDNVIEHLPAPVGTLKTLGRYLAPRGRIVVITPNMASGHFELLGRRWTPELAPHAHVFLFTPPSLTRLLGDAGYSVEYTGTFHLSIYSPVEWVVRLFSDVKGAVWRAGQEVGGIYGRLVGRGPMLYVVATRPGAGGAP